MFKSYFAIIPANVRYDKRLTANAKLLYGEITALCNEKGFCWARNSYFAELYGVDKKTVSRWISELIEYGYIFSEIKYADKSKEIKARFLKLTNAPIEDFSSFKPMDKNAPTPMDKNIPTPMDKNIPTPMDKNVPDNNKDIINNKNNNNKENTLSNERVKESERETHSHTPKKEKKKSEKKAEKKPKTKPEKKQKYGEFENVFLSDEEIAILKTEYPDEYLEKIERLSKYIETTGKKYKNHFVVIREWLREDTKPNTQNSYDLDAYEGETDFLSDWNEKQKQDEESLDYLKGL